MPKVTLNNTEYEEVQSSFLDSISARISTKLLRQRANSVTIDWMAVTSEIDRYYPGIKSKPWYKDFVMQFCRDRKIPCDKRNL